MWQEQTNKVLPPHTQVLSVVSFFLILIATNWSIGSYMPSTEWLTFLAALIGIVVATFTLLLYTTDFEAKMGRQFFLLVSCGRCLRATDFCLSLIIYHFAYRTRHCPRWPRCSSFYVLVLLLAQGYLSSNAAQWRGMSRTVTGWEQPG